MMERFLSEKGCCVRPMREYGQADREALSEEQYFSALLIRIILFEQPIQDPEFLSGLGAAGPCHSPDSSWEARTPPPPAGTKERASGKKGRKQRRKEIKRSYQLHAQKQEPGAKAGEDAAGQMENGSPDGSRRLEETPPSALNADPAEEVSQNTASQETAVLHDGISAKPPSAVNENAEALDQPDEAPGIAEPPGENAPGLPEETEAVEETAEEPSWHLSQQEGEKQGTKSKELDLSAEFKLMEDLPVKEPSPFFLSPQDEFREYERERAKRRKQTDFYSPFDEDTEEMEELVSEQDPPECREPQKNPTKIKRGFYYAVGVAVSAMSVIGLISTISWTARLIGNVANNTAQKEQFAEMVYPIVIVDPPAADSSSELPSDTVISAAIWDIILYEDTAKYPSEFGNITVPKVDVEQHATSLFGTGLRFDHKTLGDTTLAFYYDDSAQSYTIPVSPRYFPYSPLVEEIHKEGEIYTLKVGYVSPSPEWMLKDKKGKPLPDKYMEYILKKKGNQATIIAIKEIPGGIGQYSPN